MTNEEAIKSALDKVKKQKENFGFMDRFNVDENWEVMKALEKQIPKKPHYIPYPRFGNYCASCGRWLNDRYSFCHSCGQMLDWTGGEEA